MEENSSLLGKLIGTFCAISGVLVMSLPIPIITSNFEKFYKEQNKKEKAAKRKHRLRLAKKQEEQSRDEARGSGGRGGAFN